MYKTEFFSDHANETEQDDILKSSLLNIDRSDVASVGSAVKDLRVKTIPNSHRSD